ncbi:MAG TPA: hypothetical protein VJM11_12555 [Nevskiaceae bacterium]|nr:hypothetical protein [Nevskiaceae bacterium]
MTYDESWDRPHAPLDHPLWQESDCYWFRDAERGIGGFHRIGQHPNTGVGQVMLFVFEEGGQRYRHVAEHALGAGARTSSGQRVHTSGVEALGGGAMRFSWADGDCAGDLRFEDPFYLPRDWSVGGHGAAARAQMNAGGHLECAGRLRGTVRLGARELTVDALAHRDRSWGPRDVTRVAQHRMCTGTVGRAFSFAAFTLAFKPAGRHAAGFVVREGIEEDVTGVRVLATLDNDGLTAVGGETQLTLASGERLVVPCAARQSFLHVTSGYVATDAISIFTYGGQPGFCDLEIANNPHHGSHVPGPAEVNGVCITDGLSSCVDGG